MTTLIPKPMLPTITVLGLAFGDISGLSSASAQARNGSGQDQGSHHTV